MAKWSRIELKLKYQNENEKSMKYMKNDKSMKNTHIQFYTLTLFFLGEFYIVSD